MMREVYTKIAMTLSTLHLGNCSNLVYLQGHAGLAISTIRTSELCHFRVPLKDYALLGLPCLILPWYEGLPNKRPAVTLITLYISTVVHADRRHFSGLFDTKYYTLSAKPTALLRSGHQCSQKLTFG